MALDLTVIVSGITGGIQGVYTDSTHLYWASKNDKKIQRSLLDGSDIVDLVSGITNITPKGIAGHDASGFLYYTTIRDLYRVDIDGSNNILLATGASNEMQGIVIDDVGDKVYTCGTGGDDNITRYDLDGSNKTVIISGVELGGPLDLEIDFVNNKLLWVSFDNDFIGIANLDGSSSGILFNTSGSPFMVDIDVPNGKMYVTLPFEGTIVRADLDGLNVETVASGVGTVGGLSLNDGDVYVSDLTGFISRSTDAVPDPDPSPSGENISQFLRIIHRLTKTGDYDPQLISLFTNVASNVNIEVWDIIDGQNVQLTITNSGCYQIGNTNSWGWSTENFDFVGNRNKYHYYFRMTSDIAEQQFGEFFITVPEDGLWSYPNDISDSLV